MASISELLYPSSGRKVPRSRSIDETCRLSEETKDGG